jgi:hypothetical protein
MFGFALCKTAATVREACDSACMLFWQLSLSAIICNVHPRTTARNTRMLFGQAVSHAAESSGMRLWPQHNSIARVGWMSGSGRTQRVDVQSHAMQRDATQRVAMTPCHATQSNAMQSNAMLCNAMSWLNERGCACVI